MPAAARWRARQKPADNEGLLEQSKLLQPPCRSIVPVDATAQGFDFAAAFLRRNAPADAASGRLGCHPALGWHGRFQDHFGKPRAGRGPVQHLAAMLAGLKDQASVGRDPAGIELLEPFLDGGRGSVLR